MLILSSEHGLANIDVEFDKSKIEEIWNSLKSNASTIWNNIKSTIQNRVEHSKKQRFWSMG